MGPSLGIQNVVETTLRELSCPAQTLASLSGINSGRLSRIIRGHENIGGEDERRLRVAVNALRKLRDFVSPIPVQWKDFVSVKKCVDLMQAGKLSIILQAEPIASPDSNQTDGTNPLSTAGNFTTGTDDGR
jgi:hypothetical protein